MTNTTNRKFSFSVNQKRIIYFDHAAFVHQAKGLLSNNTWDKDKLFDLVSRKSIGVIISQLSITAPNLANLKQTGQKISGQHSIQILLV